jgi:excisionase family DNA binding protein
VSLLTVAQAADRARVSGSLVYEWCASKRLAHFRFGKPGRRGRILIEESDLTAFIDVCRVGAEATPAIRQSVSQAAFQNLDSDRLLSAWQQQGVLRDPPDA